MFLVCIMEIFIDWLILLILKIRRNKREKYDNEVKRDMMLLDKLLKKIKSTSKD